MGLLATFTYGNLGRRTSLVRGNGTSTTCSHGTADHLIALSQANGELTCIARDPLDDEAHSVRL